LFTDGLRDIKNSKSEQFGDVSLESFFHSMKDKHLSVVKSELELKIKTFSHGASYADDITWMGIEVI
jgi:serine phosphatase RsbU (regulator of sigma subunit)